MLFSELIAAYSDNRTQHIITLWAVGLMSVSEFKKSSGMLCPSAVESGLLEETCPSGMEPGLLEEPCPSGLKPGLLEDPCLCGLESGLLEDQCLSGLESGLL
jgi:hypothetical protein